MPAKSKSQMKMLHMLEAKGKVPPGTAAKFDVGGKAYHRLPEHVRRKKKR